MKTRARISLIVMFLIVNIAIGSTIIPSEVFAEEKPIEIILSIHFTPAYKSVFIPLQKFMDRVEKESNGRIKFKFFHSGQLHSGRETLPAVERGDADMTQAIDLYYMGTIPEFGISAVPFQWSNNESVLKSINAGLWDIMGVNQKLREKHNMEVIGTTIGGGFYQFWSKTPVAKPEDFKGKIWRVSGSGPSKIVEALGGTPATMASGEVYMALQRGTIDGIVSTNTTGWARKFFETAKYVDMVNLNVSLVFLPVNLKKWNSIPKDLQEIMKKAGKAWQEDVVEVGAQEEADLIGKLKDVGVKFHYATPEELATFKKATQPAVDWWLKKVPEGQKYIDFVKANR